MTTNTAWPGTRRADVIAIVMFLVLAGCGTTSPPGTDLGDYTAAPRDLIGVTSITDQHVVRLGGGYLGKEQRDELAAFITNVAGNRPESLRVTLHGPARAAPLKAVADALVADGVGPNKITLADERSGPHSRPGTVVVAVVRAIAVEPNCPGWVDHISAPEDNRSNPNFGCSDVSNFAAMVGDPHHLRAAASSIYDDGERGATAVANYRADKVKDLPRVNEQFSVIPTAH